MHPANATPTDESAREVLDLVRALPADHAARAHALRLARSLGAVVHEPFPELRQTVAWHFCAHLLSCDPQHLVIERSGHAGGMHADLIVRRGSEWLCAYTWTSGVRVILGAWHGSYVTRFLLSRPSEERLLRNAIAREPHPDALRCPAVAAATFIRRATDPPIGWWADVPGGEYGDPEGTVWELAVREAAPPHMTVDLATGRVAAADGREWDAHALLDLLGESGDVAVMLDPLGN